jgi:CheY-like chemotaxis protein
MANLRDRHVLLVDDEPAIRELFSMALQRAGADVAEAADGIAALKRVCVRAPDVVITDVTMPRLDGIELIKRLRKNPVMRDVPIIVVSGQGGSDAVAALARQAGCDAVVSKPCTIEALLSAVNDTIARRPAHLA